MHTQRFGPVKQWGFVVRDLDAAMQCWVEQLGVGPWWGYRNVRLNSRFQGIESEVLLDVALSYQNGVQIELIQQRDDSPSPYRAFYATPHAQMLHQVAYMVPDLDAALLEAKAAGLTKNVSFESLRWTAAVRDYRTGMPPERLRLKMGLSEISWRETVEKIRILAAPGL
jgi:hypothetical protein